MISFLHKKMNTKLFAIALAFIGLNSFAQITVTDSDVVEQGDIVYMAYDSNPSSLISIGLLGMNQAWDFSTLQVSSVDTELYISPIGTQYENLYPIANLCLSAEGSISYFNKTSSGVYVYGLNDTVFNLPALFLPLPLAFGLSVTDGPVVVVENYITGPLLSIALPASTVANLTSNLANIADTALIQITNTSEFSVDGSGVITTPLGSYDVLRLKEIKEIYSVLNIYCSDTITQQGMWFDNIPFSAIPILAGSSNNEQEITYRWITNDTSVTYLVAAAVVDSFNNIEEASFQISPLSNNITELSSGLFNVYPIPVSDKLMVNSKNNDLTYLELVALNGKVILKKEFIQSTSLDVSHIIKGIYFLNLKTSEGELTKQIIIE